MTEPEPERLSLAEWLVLGLGREGPAYRPGRAGPLARGGGRGRGGGRRRLAWHAGGASPGRQVRAHGQARPARPERDGLAGPAAGPAGPAAPGRRRPG